LAAGHLAHEGAWGSGVLGRTTQTLGNLTSGYIYRHDASMPCLILSGAFLVLGALFMTLVREPDVAEV
jgi:hypothetical protein